MTGLPVAAVDVAVSPYSIVVPDVRDTISLHEYVSRTLDLRRLSDLRLVSLVVSGTVVSRLMEIGLYPIKRYFDGFPAGTLPPEVSAQDLNAVVLRMLDRSLALESELGIDDVLISRLSLDRCSRIAWLPSLTPEQGGEMEEMRSQLIGRLVLAGRLGRSISMHCNSTNASSVVVDSEIDYAVGALVSDRAVEFPLLLRESLNIVNDTASIVDVIDPVAVWIGANEDARREGALMVAYVKRSISNGLGCNMDSIPKFEFHPEFSKSAERLGCMHQIDRVRGLLDAMVRHLSEKRAFDSSERGGRFTRFDERDRSCLAM